MTNLIQYRKYRPQAGARVVIDLANTIIADAEADGWHSMTLRQLYYQFVSRGFIPNAVSEYKRLGRIITDARYGGLVSWTAIEDAGRGSYHFPENPTAEQVLNGIERKLTIDPWANQDTVEFLDWVAARLVHVYGESKNVDFVLSLRERTEALKDARTGEGLE